MKKSNNFIVIAILVIVAFWGFVFIVGSDNDINTENSTTQTISFSDNSITTNNSESTTEVSTEESTTLSETTKEEPTTEEATTKKSEITTKKAEATSKKENTTKKTESTTKKKTEATTKKVENTTKESKITYVLNISTMKFHYKSCWAVDKIDEENYSTYKGTREEVIDMGYSPCGHCDP